MIGEVSFDACGRRWRLFLGNAARCAVEEQYDRGFFGVVSDAIPDLDPETAVAIAQAMATGAAPAPEIAERAAGAMRNMRLSILRDLAWHGLVKFQPDVRVDDVSDIIDELGDDAFGDIMGRAIRAAQPKAQEAGGDAGPGKPRKKPPRSRTTGPTGAG
jgi:hypothetical protein